jgi:chromosome segregation protein
MHLSSLTLKGFKSFASPTTFRFEPGITCVVGPNGSGKSNVVDAIAWVLGEHSAKSLRGGAMSDVIFAGTPGRPPLGRAEVTLTIDNHDGALPIEHAEVSVSRLLYRSGDSEYAINGTACRLLDVQELLSDTGIGRELHVIVGQGQLDAVLHARPEDRRAFIEEAAGVLKHRRRKEKALRKLDAMQANLTRLTDLTAELRRQLGPLGRQAEVARRAHLIAAAQRDAKLRLLADDLGQARGALEAEVRDEQDVRRRQSEAEATLHAALQQESRLEALVAEDAPRVARAQEIWYRLSALEERLRGLASLAAERARHLAEPAQEIAPGRDPEQLEAEAELARDEERQLLGALAADREALEAVVARRAAAETELAAEEAALVAGARALADRREGLARLAGEVSAQRTRAAAAEEEIGRHTVSLDAARQRARGAQADFDALAAEVRLLDEDELDLDDRHESAARSLEAAEERLATLEAEEREAERQRSSWLARRDALALSLAGKDGAAALVETASPGLLGRVAALLHVESGREAAVAVALGAIADAVAVATLDDAVAAVRRLAADDGGRAGILVGGAQPDPDPAPAPLPAGAVRAVDVVRVPAALTAALTRALAGVVLVPDLDSARALVAARPDLRAVTPSGDLIGAHWAVGGSASVPSVLEVQAHYDEARQQYDEAVHQAERLRFALAAARDERAATAATVDEALEALHEHDARIAAVHERLALLGSQARGAHGEAERLERSRREAEAVRDTALAELAPLEERQSLAEGTAEVGERSAEERDRLAAACQQVRGEEVEARLAVRTGEERGRALAGRADALLRAAAAERAGRERLLRVRAERSRGAVIAAAVTEVAREALAALARSLATAAERRDAATSERTVREGELLDARARVRQANSDADGLRDVLHRDEVARTEQRLRVEQLEQRAVEEWGVPVEELLADYGPNQPVPGEPDAEGVPGPETAYDRATQERRAAAADRQLALLGKVNPLALEEFDALQERHGFLSRQLEDLRTTRRDLLGIVKDVDERIHDVFKAAFDDTAREFERVFATLFPGGEGRLVLTEPEDLMVTGVDVEARPPGKRVKRLSLLSGGERSLTAVALLLAIFRARPSPFYILDEVEAALDDTNLGRLLDALDGLRASSQLIVVTHQKRTMEIADALYGVTMRGDGVSEVISQRLREREPEPAPL